MARRVPDHLRLAQPVPFIANALPYSRPTRNALYMTPKIALTASTPKINAIIIFHLPPIYSCAHNTAVL